MFDVNSNSNTQTSSNSQTNTNTTIACCEHCAGMQAKAAAPDPAPAAKDAVTGGGNAFVNAVMNNKLTALGALFYLLTGILNAVFNLHGTASGYSKGPLLLIVYIVCYLLIAHDVLLHSLKNILRGKVFDENFLMSVSSIGAFCIGEYPEAVAVMLFYKIGEAFEANAVNKSRSNIKHLIDIKPEYAFVLRGGGYIKTSPKDVSIGETILVKAGEKVPLDGIVLDGISALDTSALTGEALPVNVEPGSEVLSGSINKNGVLTIKVTSTMETSTVYKILELVESASAKKSRIENFITRFARYYTPFVVIAAVFIAFAAPVIAAFVKNGFLLDMGAVFNMGYFSGWIQRALVFLVVSCPCALVISVPLSFFAGIGAASREGILIKGSAYMEALYKARAIVFDKTGTLTKGTFKVSTININEELKGQYSEEDILYFAAHTEAYSSHPLAASICNEYKFRYNKAFNQNPDTQNAAANVEELAGKGVKAVVNGKNILAGNGKLLDAYDVPYKVWHGAGTVIYIAIDNIYAASIIINDVMKKDAPDAVRELKSLGIKNISLFTGDTKLSAEAVAKEAGIDNVESGLLPNDKALKIEELKAGMAAANKARGTVIFAGDGINDAPSLAISDAGIAMGAAGSAAAIEAADIVLMNDELKKIPLAMRIAKKTHGVAMQNVIFALGVKGAILLLSATGLLVSIWLAVFGDVGVCFIAILNSMRSAKRP